MTDLLLLAKLSSLAYEVDATKLRAGVAALGGHLLAYLQNGDCHALVVAYNDEQVLVYRGTPVVENTSVKELLCNVELEPLDLGPLGSVPRGPFLPLVGVFGQVERLGLNPTVITGHSLGGWRALQSRVLYPWTEVVTFGAPKAGNAQFWQAVYKNSPPVCLIHEQDFAPDWPEVSAHGWEAYPGPFWWLHAGEMLEATSRPGINLSLEDHDIDTGYVAPLAALAKLTHSS